MAYVRNVLVALACRRLHQLPMARLAEVARSCGVSAATLRRVIRAETGLCLRAWRQTHLRSIAEELLTGRSLHSVKEVGGAMGFASQQSFARWFHRQTGLTPSAFRERAAPPPGESGFLPPAAHEDRDTGQGRSSSPPRTMTDLPPSTTAATGSKRLTRKGGTLRVPAG